MRCEAHTRFWWEEQIERYDLQDPGRNEGIILRWIFRKWDMRE
jgi:hypothetical protein